MHSIDILLSRFYTIQAMSDESAIYQKLLLILELKKEYLKLSFLIHTLEKDHRQYDEIYEKREAIYKIYEAFGYSPFVNDNMGKLSILVYMYEHPFEKVTHDLFDVNEYLYYDDKCNCICDENGNIFEPWEEGRNIYNGFYVRTGEQWEYGWHLYDGKNEMAIEKPQ